MTIEEKRAYAKVRRKQLKRAREKLSRSKLKQHVEVMFAEHFHNFSADCIIATSAVDNKVHISRRSEFQALWITYKKWCRASKQERLLSENMFGRHLGKTFFKRKVDGRISYHCIIRPNLFLDDTIPDDDEDLYNTSAIMIG